MPYKDQAVAAAKHKLYNRAHMRRKRAADPAVNARNREYMRMLRINDPMRQRALDKKRRTRDRNNVQRRISILLRNSVRWALRRNGKVNKRSSRVTSLLGCSIDSFRIYIESKFEPGMSWDNHGRTGWHLDHIIPCSLFDLSDPVHQRYCFHFSNLQPLWAHENCSKKDKLVLTGQLPDWWTPESNV